MNKSTLWTIFVSVGKSWTNSSARIGSGQLRMHWASISSIIIWSKCYVFFRHYIKLNDTTLTNAFHPFTSHVLQYITRQPHILGLMATHSVVIHTSPAMSQRHKLWYDSRTVCMWSEWSWPVVIVEPPWPPYRWWNMVSSTKCLGVASVDEHKHISDISKSRKYKKLKNTPDLFFFRGNWCQDKEETNQPTRISTSSSTKLKSSGLISFNFSTGREIIRVK